MWTLKEGTAKPCFLAVSPGKPQDLRAVCGASRQRDHENVTKRILWTKDDLDNCNQKSYVSRNTGQRYIQCTLGGQMPQ